MSVLHAPVLTDAVLSIVKRLHSGSGSVLRVLDATCGTGGHAHALLDRFPLAAVTCLDVDASALEAARSRLAGYGPRADFVRSSFSGATAALPQGRSFTAVLADLGLGTHTLAHKGFSFRTDGPLDMRFGAPAGAAAASGIAAPASHASPVGVAPPWEEEEVEEEEHSLDPSSPSRTAADVLAKWPAWRLRAIFETYGDVEPRLASTLASAIVAWRGSGETSRRIKSTLELRYVVESACAFIQHEQGGSSGGKATASASGLAQRPRGEDAIVRLVGRANRRGFCKASLWVDRKGAEKVLHRLSLAKPAYPHEVRAVWQALRVAVNDELGSIATFLTSVPRLLCPGGAVMAIAYQPHEARLIQAAFAALAGPGGAGRWDLLTPLDAPITPSPEEVKANRRARSARLYALQRRGTTEVGEELETEAECAMVAAATSAATPRVATDHTQLQVVSPLVRFSRKPARVEEAPPARVRIARRV